MGAATAKQNVRDRQRGTERKLESDECSRDQQSNTALIQLAQNDKIEMKYMKMSIVHCKVNHNMNII